MYTISNCLSQHNVEHCVIAGDFNTDLSSVNSGNTVSLKAFLMKKIYVSLWTNFQTEYHIHALALETIIH